MTIDEQIAAIRAARRAVWVSDPITRIPINEQAARDAAARAAYNDGKQELTTVIG